MLRTFVIAAALISVMYACSNDLSTIGQEVMDNDNYIGEKSYNVDNTGTVKVDSFATSCGFYAAAYIDRLVIGRYEDQYSGTTRAVPCFQVSPQGIPEVPEDAVLDSITLKISYGGLTWGDTIYDMKKQTFHLYRIQDVPEFDYEKNGLFYNNTPVKVAGEPISTTTFYPTPGSIDKAYFKIDQALGEDLFERIRYKSDKDEDIYDPGLSTEIAFPKFIEYMKGLAIVPDDSNDCLITIKAASDQLYMDLHYSVFGTTQVVRFPLSHREYQYNNITNTPIAAFAGLTDQEQTVYMKETGMSFTQGLAGYMVKMTLPFAPNYGQYRTILKAQLEIKPEYILNDRINPPKTITVYLTNDRNELKGLLNNSNKTPVTGILQEDLLDRNKSRYLFDMTEYYQRLSSMPTQEKAPQILLSVPNDGISGIATSFDQMVLKEVPVLRIHYAKYK